MKNRCIYHGYPGREETPSREIRPDFLYTCWKIQIFVHNKLKIFLVDTHDKSSNTLRCTAGCRTVTPVHPTNKKSKSLSLKPFVEKQKFDSQNV